MDLTKTSRFISLILRHKPETIAISLDEHGQANVSELIDGISKTQYIDMAMLEKTVGSRHGKPVIYEIHASEMYNDGYVFYMSVNGVWLTQAVPTKYMKKL